jgi:hypothetical protein
MESAYEEGGTAHAVASDARIRCHIVTHGRRPRRRIIPKTQYGVFQRAPAGRIHSA